MREVPKNQGKMTLPVHDVLLGKMGLCEQFKKVRLI
jgi:hypothetical protein